MSKLSQRGQGVNPQQLVEAICAAHLAHYVEGSLEQRGGLMLVGPPGALKSTLSEALSHYADALPLSDINIPTLTNLRDSLATGSITTLVFTEYAKVYERNPQTAVNIEGTLRAMASEGFSAASFEDSRIARRKAFATIIGAMPPKTRERNFNRWEESGFNRRFLWSTYGLKGAHILDDAAVNLIRLDLGVRDIIRVPPIGREIPMLLTSEEKARVKVYVAQQPGGSHTQQLQLLSRMWAVLKWWHRENGKVRRAEETISAFVKSLSREGTDLDLRGVVKPLAKNGRK